MAENLFEAWGAPQGSLARLGDTVVAAYQTADAYLASLDKGTPYNPDDPLMSEQGDLRHAHEDAEFERLQAQSAYYQAHLKYEELRGKK